jgi:uncharacterized protein (TIGR03435 family)
MRDRRFASAAAAFVAVAYGLHAQSPAPRPAFEAFEVASIKPADPDSKGRFIRMQSADRFVARNHALKTLIAAAYNLSPRAVSGGPDWVDSEHYDILAKTPGEVRPNLEEQMKMLRKLLADRFQLDFRREIRELPIYALTLARNGSKLRPTTVSPDAAPEGPPPLIFVLSPEGASLPGRSATTGELASVIQRAALDRPVLDRTGLTGRYDFDLQWLPDETQFGGAGAWKSDDAARPDLFTAIQQQLGLRLEATRGPVETLVIRHAEKPSAN